MRRRLGRAVTLLLALALPLLAAGVSVSVDKKEVVRGDTVTFSITAHGKEVAFPVVKEIEGFPILGTSQRSSIAIVNGQVDKSFTKSYTFAPMKDVTVPPLKVVVDGQEVTTDPVVIKVVDAPKAVATGGGVTQLSLELEKSDLHVGEPVEMTLTLRYPRGTRFAQVELQKPEFPNFWIKKLGEATREYDGEYEVQKQRYLLFPQKAGHYKLGPLTAKLAKRVRVKPPIDDPFFDDDFFNGFFARLQWSRIASNSVEVDVAPLPGGVELYGDFTIRAEADKTQVEANKPVRITVTVEGEGNVEDIAKFEPDIPGAVIYADDPVVKEWVKNGVYGGTFTQTITVVADRDFTVPPFTLRYYDPKKGEVVEKKTGPIFVKVVGGAPAPAATKRAPVTAATATDEEKSSKSESVQTDSGVGVSGWLAAALLLLGAVLGAGGVLAAGRLKLRWRERAKPPVARQILRARSDKELFDLLLPYAKEDAEIDEAVKKLEANIYQGTRHKIDKALMAEIVEELENA
ncbi:BatD family protein [Hydrogenimonas sp.]